MGRRRRAVVKIALTAAAVALLGLLAAAVVRQEAAPARWHETVEATFDENGHRVLYDGLRAGR